MAVETLILTVLIAGCTVTNVNSRSTALSCLRNQCPGRLQPLPDIDTAQCLIDPPCDPMNPYRTLEGFCSNLADSSWGWVDTPFIRWLPSDYADNVMEPRRSVEGLPLPPPRQLSVYNFEDHYAPSDCNVLNLMQFGQLIAHDTSQHRPTIPEERCCSDDWQLLPFNQVPEGCLPIGVSPYDPFYSQFCITCLPFARSRQATLSSCPGQPAEQVNEVTHVLDASFIYGSDSMKAMSLREFDGGRLRVQTTPDGRTFPPQSPMPETDCTNPPEETTCFYAGDTRVNQHPGVTTYQIVFLRYHNYIADELSQLNPFWSDETLYQETRRIVWAVFENIIYKEYLPTVLGNDFVRAKGLLVDSCCDCCINYLDPTINPSTFSEVAGAAFRSFHSQVPREIVLYNQNYQPYNVLLLDKYYNRPTVLVQSGVLDGILRGFTVQPEQNQDRCLSVALTVFLYRDYKTPYGQDLGSIDIQRGRDYGLASYNRFRELCGLRRARTFADFADTISPENIRRLEQSYRCVDDVDLYVGGLFEGLIPGTLVGPTFQCLIGEQFFNYMRGDRFYYENCGQPTSFTPEQRNAIYKSNLADIFCTTGDDIRSITLDTFHKPSRGVAVDPNSELGSSAGSDDVASVVVDKPDSDQQPHTFLGDMKNMMDEVVDSVFHNDVIADGGDCPQQLTETVAESPASAEGQVIVDNTAGITTVSDDRNNDEPNQDSLTTEPVTNPTPDINISPTSGNPDNDVTNSNDVQAPNILFNLVDILKLVLNLKT